MTVHPEAYAAMAQMLNELGIDQWRRPFRALDVGGRRINTDTRGLLPTAVWTGLDICPGPGVDIVADAASWEPDQQYEFIQATELLEHTPVWREIIATCHRALLPGGYLLITCASTGREPHGAEGTSAVPSGQHYGNIKPTELWRELDLYFGLTMVRYQYPPGDAYGWAAAPKDLLLL